MARWYIRVMILCTEQGARESARGMEYKASQFFKLRTGDQLAIMIMLAGKAELCCKTFGVK
jgi:hypothetical protein